MFLLLLLFIFFPFDNTRLRAKYIISRRVIVHSAMCIRSSPRNAIIRERSVFRRPIYTYVHESMNVAFVIITDTDGIFSEFAG